ncbi:MAG TPA: orotidine-5'-phosphate decarboxylase [Rhodothermales bacterium]
MADAKRGDIGNSARFYASAVFEDLGCDACTVSPYMGADSIQPFLAFPGRAAYVLVRTSNPGATELQELPVGNRPLYLEAARQIVRWSGGQPGEAGFVVGATNAAPIQSVREAHPDVPLLIPGVGAQGGDADAVLDAVAEGNGPVLINSSRQIIYASSGTDFAEAAAREADHVRGMLQPRARTAG